MLRHTYAMRLYSAEHDLRAVQVRLSSGNGTTAKFYLSL